MSHKIFEINLVAIHKRKVTLKLNKPAYIGMCILELSKVLMYKFHYDLIYITFDFSNYLTNSKHFDDSNKLVIRKMQDETSGAATEEFVVLNPKMYSFLLDNTYHKTAKGMNRNVIATKSHNKYKDVLLNNKSKKHSIKRIQSKDHRIGNVKSTKLSYFDSKIYIYLKQWI